MTAIQCENQYDSASIFYETYTAANSTENSKLQEMRWLAPECLRDAEFTHKSDVWAMGVVIYEVRFGLYVAVLN